MSESVAYTQGMSMADILAVASWLSDSMFKKFYSLIPSIASDKHKVRRLGYKARSFMGQLFTSRTIHLLTPLYINRYHL